MRNKRNHPYSGCATSAFLGLVLLSCLNVYSQRAAEEDIHYRTAILAVTFSADGKLLASTSGWIIGIWSVTRGEKIREIRLPPSDGSIVGVSFSQDGSLLYGGSADGRLLQWQVDTGKQLDGLIVKPDASAPSYAFFVQAVAFSHDRTLFANGIHTGEVNVWDTHSGKHIARLSGSHGEIRSLAFSPSDSLLAVGNSNDLILVWNLKEHGDPRVLHRDTTQEPPGWIYAALFLPDGKTLASSGFHPGVILWDVSTAKQSSLIGPSYDWVESIDISADGTYLLTGSKNANDRDPKTHIPRSHRISLWSVKSATVLKEFTGAVPAFSPDGQQIAISEGQNITFRPLK